VKRFLIAFSCLVAAAFAFQSASQKTDSGINIQGKVLQEPGGQPIRKASVRFIARDGQSNGQYSDTTDAEGRFKIDDVKPGRYMATVEHPSFVQSAGGKRPTSILLQPGQGTTDLFFYMQPAAVITGKVTDLDGDPMSNVSIGALRVGSALRGMNFHDSGRAATNDLGEFRIPNLRAGRYTITASSPQGPQAPHAEPKDNVKENLIYTTTYYPGTLDKEQAVAVEVHPGDETLVNFGVLASPGYRLAGTVVPVPSGADLTEINLSSKDHRIVQGQQLGEGGRFEFQNVLPGSYTATLEVVTGLSEGQPATKMMPLVEPIEVSTADVDRLQLQPNPGGAVRGKFRMDTGKGFDWTQLNVFLLPVDENDFGVTFTVGAGVIGGVVGASGGPAMSGVNKDGSFELKNVTGGSYWLLVRAKANTLRDYITKSVNVNGRDVSDSGFIVSGGTSLDVVMSANVSTIEGTVVDSKGKPVAHATVLDVPSAEHRIRHDLYQRDTTDELGHFNLRGLNPGKYTVLAFDELEADIRQPEFFNSYEGRGEHVQLDEGARTSIVVTLIATDIEEP
jgi:protocatechuate 3,4-dioxygenase beta subunit